MEEKLLEYLDEIVQALKQGIDFAGEQAPLVVQEYLSYAVYYHWALIICSLVVFVIMLFGIRVTYKKYKDQSRWDDWEVGVTLFLLGSFLPLGVAVGNILQLIKISIAPRVYLIEEISKLL